MAATSHNISPQIVDFLRKLPKAELHLHIEGSLEADLAFRLSKKNDIPVPGGATSVEELRALYSFDGLQSFLNLYYACMDVLITEEDFYDLAMAYFERAHADGVVHVEPFFDPQAHTKRGVSYKTIIKGLHRAGVDAKERFGMTVLWIASFLRDESVESAQKTLDSILAKDVRDLVIAVGLDSAEQGHPPSKFTKVYKRARAAGLYAVAHAGEEGGWENVRDSVDLLGVRRIDHGVRILESEEYTAHVAKLQIPLTVCPLSNLALKGVSHLSEHNIGKMLDAGLAVTINSDDPAYFYGYILENFIRTHTEANVSVRNLIRCARNSLAGSMWSPRERHLALTNFDRYVAEAAPDCI